MNKEIKKQLEAQLGDPIDFNESGGFKYPFMVRKACHALIDHKEVELIYCDEERKGVLVPEIAALTDITREIDVDDLKDQIVILQRRLKEVYNEII